MNTKENLNLAISGFLSLMVVVGILLIGYFNMITFDIEKTITIFITFFICFFTNMVLMNYFTNAVKDSSLRTTKYSVLIILFILLSVISLFVCMTLINELVIVIEIGEILYIVTICSLAYKKEKKLLN